MSKSRKKRIKRRMSNSTLKVEFRESWSLDSSLYALTHSTYFHGNVRLIWQWHENPRQFSISQLAIYSL